jgi:hypothetical protein
MNRKNANDLMPVWVDINEALEHMNWLADRQNNWETKKVAKNGSRILARARKTLGEVVGMNGIERSN